MRVGFFACLTSSMAHGSTRRRASEIARPADPVDAPEIIGIGDRLAFAQDHHRPSPARRTATRRTGCMRRRHASGCGPPRWRATSDGQMVLSAPRCATRSSSAALKAPSSASGCVVRAVTSPLPRPACLCAARRRGGPAAWDGAGRPDAPRDGGRPRTAFSGRGYLQTAPTW